MMESLRNESLEDVYWYLCKDKPHRNSKDYKKWDYLESIAYEELLCKEEHPNECTKIINEIVDFLIEQRKKAGLPL